VFQGLEVLHAIELARVEASRGDWRAKDHFDDAGREPFHFVHDGAQVAVQAGKEGCVFFT